LIVSDGDTLPAEEIPTRSPALDRVLVLGVGDPFRGTFIHDHISRQDRRSLSQFASQVRGEYLDVNQNHVPSDSLPSGPLQRDSDDALAWRQLALLAVAMGCSMLALLPVALVLGGGSWNPQRQPTRELTREHFDDVWSIHS
jgi:hypothetical protein